MNKKSSNRTEVIEALNRFEKSTTSMKTLLREMQTTSPDSVDSLIRVQSLALSIIRFRNTIDYLLSKSLSRRQITNLSITNKNTLRLLLYETKWLCSDIDELFKSFPDLKKYESKLRTVIFQDLDDFFQKMPDVNRLSLRYSHPTFIVRTLLDNLPLDETISLLNMNNQRRSYYLRPNLFHENSYSIIKTLSNIELEQESNFSNLYRVNSGIDQIVSSPHFKEGQIIIQDLASIVTVKSLNPQPGEKIWDSCAAPGMKTQYIAELMEGKGEIIATDVYEERVRIANEQTRKFNIPNVNWLQADATQPVVRDADRVLIDAPCTSTGILQAYPSFKWRLNKDSLFALMTIQNKILDGILTTYADRPGTEVVFSTCSILPHEGESQIDSAMKKHKIELLEPYPFGDRGYSKFNCSRYVRRLFPHKHNTSGFFIARMRIMQ